MMLLGHIPIGKCEIYLYQLHTVDGQNIFKYLLPASVVQLVRTSPIMRVCGHEYVPIEVLEFVFGKR